MDLRIKETGTDLCQQPAVCHTPADAMKLTIGISLKQMVLCGIIWPLVAMPSQWMMTLARLLPMTEAAQGMRDVMQKGWGINQSSSLLYGLGISSAWVVVLLSLSWMLIGKKLK